MTENQDRDRLADLLSEMADGRHTEPEDEQPQDREDENERVESEVSPEQGTVAPAEPVAATEKTPSEVPASTVAAPDAPRETQGAAHAAEVSPPAHAPAAQPRRAKSSAPPSPARARPSAPVAPVLGGDIDTPIDPTTADVSSPVRATHPPVAEPARPPRMVPAPSANRLYTQQQFRLMQAIAFKRTLIPILLTTGLLCLAAVLLGWISSSESPFSAFQSLLFTIPMLLIGLVLLFFGSLTILQVKNDLIRTAPPNAPPSSHPQAP